MMDKEEFIKYAGKINERIREKLKDDGVALEFYSHLVVCFNRICDESQKQKEVIDKAMEYINKNLILVSILDGVKTFGLNSYTFDYKKLLHTLKGGQNG